jgi:SpoIID/LytB domain protein
VRRWSALVASAATVLALGTVPARAAAAPQTFSWPSTGSLSIVGHGNGHGHGLSQYGAYGAALRGLDAAHILAFYYPGTAAATLTEPALRVWITAAPAPLEVAPRSGLRAATADGTVTLPTTLASATVTRWRAVRAAAGTYVQGLTGSTWRTFVIGGKSAHAGTVEFAGAGTVRVVLGSTLREYRGSVRAVPTGASPGQRTVVVTSLPDYLRSVVPSEMPAGWSAAALQAQAVAARTYALYDRAHEPAGSAYDTCDSTSCQVFSGAAEYTLGGSLLRSFEATSSDTAVTATRGQVRLYSSALAFTQFSASNGGWTADGGQPYLRAYPDPYDGVVPSTAHTWTDTILTATVQAAYPSIGTLRSVTVLRDGNGEWGGRVTSIVLHGSGGQATVDGDTFRSVTGLRSTWWAPANAGWSGYDAVLGVHDWNGDTRDDLITRTPSGELWLYPGAGGAVLGTRQRIGTGFWAFSALLAPGDWNGDGAPDIIGRRTSDGSLWLYPGTGHGGFLAGRRIGTGFWAFSALIGPGDWNGDGHPDLLARRTSDGSLWLYPGDGHGGFLPARQVGTGFWAFSALVGPGDWNGDGPVDLIGRRTSDNTLWLYPGNGHGGFLRARQIGTGWGSFRVLAAGHDLDGDHHPDLVGVSTANTAYLYPGNGSGGFRPSSPIGTP